MKLTKTLKFKLQDINPHDFYILNQTQRQFRKCLNFYLHQIGSKGSITKTYYKEEYKKAKSIFQLPTAIIQQARDFAINQYKSYKNNENNSKYPHFRGFTEVRYDKRSITFKNKNEESNEINISLATTQGRIEATLKGGEYQFEEFQNSEFQDARLFRQNNEFYLNIHIQKDIEIQEAETADYYIGVDLGVNNLATIAVQNRDGEVVETKFFDGLYVGEKRRRYNEKRREYMLKGLWSKLQESRGEEKRFMKDTNHKISKYIKNLCKKYEDSVVVMEKLDGVRDSINSTRKQNRRLHNWNFNQLQEFVIYKAHEVGSSIRRVPPFKTSQVCRSCFNQISRSNRNAVVGTCETCKKEALNVDLNAAVNIIQRLWYYIFEDTVSQTELCESSSDQGSIEGKGGTAAVDMKYQLVSQLNPSLP